MNKQTLDVLLKLNSEPFVNQRVLAENCGYSLGAINQSLKELVNDGFVTKQMKLTQEGKNLLRTNKPRNAIILAAGFGMRSVPINLYTPKPLLKLNGECLIERLIRQLHEVGVNDITVVVGFMKDSFEYLIDEYDVKLVYNSDYMHKHNLSSLNLVVDDISNTYIMPSDIWCRNNPFNDNELYSWYMVADMAYASSNVRVNRKSDLVKVASNGNALVGICYLNEEKAVEVRNKVKKYSSLKEYDDKFWEEALFEKDRMTVNARVIKYSDYVEINSYEQLNEINTSTASIQNDALSVIADTLKCSTDEITDIRMLKKGVTNHSFVFNVKGDKYIMKIPSDIDNVQINRRNEKEVYDLIKDTGLCDVPVYFNAENGYRISHYIENARCCNKDDIDDVRMCMRKLKQFHDMKLASDLYVDLFERINKYEELWNGNRSVFGDYKKTKKNVFGLREFIESHKNPYQLIHMDAVHDNFLFDNSRQGEMSLQLIDWETAGMQDKNVDVAMFAIDAMYDKEQTDKLIDIYYEEECDDLTRTMIYCYMSVCGLMLSNWCEYKRNMGVEFGEYSLRQYRYAKDYCRYATEMIKGLENGVK